MITRGSHNDRGFVLVMTLLFASLLVILIVPYISRVSTEYNLMSKMCNSNIAFNVAEAGIERAIWEIPWGGKFTTAPWTVSGSGWTTRSSYPNGIPFQKPGVRWQPGWQMRDASESPAEHSTHWPTVYSEIMPIYWDLITPLPF